MSRHRSEEAQDVARALVGRTPEHGGWTRTNCPLCLNHGEVREDTKMSLSVSQRGYYQCWRCGAKGWLADDDRALLPQDEAQDSVEVVFPPPQGFASLAELCGSVFAQAVFDYLRSRRLDVDLMEHVGMGACLTGWLAGRVVVPVLGPNGRSNWRGWVARDWTNTAERRYLYPRGMKRGELLFNEAALHVETSEPLLVVEGIFDALPYWPDACACLGKPTDDQIELLVEARRPVVFALDGDAWVDAWCAAGKLNIRTTSWVENHQLFDRKIEAGQITKPIGWVKLPPLEDPGSVDSAWLRRCARNPRGITDTYETLDDKDWRLPA